MDSKTATELLDGLRKVGNLHEFAELFGFDWYDESDWTWHDVAVKMADELEQAVAATLGSGECEMIPSFTEPSEMDDCQEFCCSKCGEYMVIQQFPGIVEEVPNYCSNCGAANMKAVKR